MASLHKAAKSKLSPNEKSKPIPINGIKIYSILHTQVLEQPALMDSELLHDLQRFLQTQATLDKVDVSAHAEWSAWLNGPSS